MQFQRQKTNTNTEKEDTFLNWKDCFQMLTLKGEDSNIYEDKLAETISMLREMCPETKWYYSYTPIVGEKESDPVIFEAWLKKQVASVDWPFPSTVFMLVNPMNHSEWKVLFPLKTKLPHFRKTYSMSVSEINEFNAVGWSIKIHHPSSPSEGVSL